VFGARATATSALTGSLNVGTSGATMSQPSPTAGVRQPAGTAIPVITSTTVVAIATATVPRSAPVSATATIPRLAPTAVKPATSVAYQVVAGDTLWGIATRYGSSVDAIVSANRLVDADSIVPGARLVIPR
jgi:LysM repeat protein